MGWDLNPRDACAPAGFQDRCLQPLGHPSIVVNQGLHADADKYKSGNGHGMVTALGQSLSSFQSPMICSVSPPRAGLPWFWRVPPSPSLLLAGFYAGHSVDVSSWSFQHSLETPAAMTPRLGSGPKFKLHGHSNAAGSPSCRQMGDSWSP